MKKGLFLIAGILFCLATNACGGKGAIIVEFISEGGAAYTYSAFPLVQLTDLQIMSSWTSLELSCTLDGRPVNEVSVGAGEKKILKCSGDKLPEYSDGVMQMKLVWWG